MSNDYVYLNQNVQIEPLCDQWYAWPHLIPPATAARNITEGHLKLLDSYLNAPAVHASAAKNPQLLGGPFIDHGGKRVEELRALRDRTKKERADLIALSAALGELNTLLLGSAKGFSLQSLYEQVPAMLRGYVELTYDLNNHPTYRIIEPLLYQSNYYHTHTQSLMLRTITADHRPFVLSTPRLEDETSVHLRLPFSDPRIDSLFKLKTIPQPWFSVRDQFDIDARSEAAFRSFFTETPPPPYEPFQGQGIRWRYFGHACILIETDGLNLLFDPVLSYTYESSISRYTYADLPDVIDYVFITHNHQDHILMETLLQLRHQIRNIVVPRNSYGMLQDPSLKLLFEAIGFDHVIELNECQSLQLSDDGDVMGIPFFGEHGDLSVGTKLAYLVRLGGHTLLFAADSCNIEPFLYEHVHRIVGDIDMVFIGMECDGAPCSWVYGPLMPQRLERAMDQSRRLAGSNYEQAMQIVNQFHAKEVYVYAMGQEPWLNYIMSVKYTDQSRPIVDSTRLIADCISRGIHAERLFGEKTILLTDSCASTMA